LEAISDPKAYLALAVLGQALDDLADPAYRYAADWWLTHDSQPWARIAGVSDWMIAAEMRDRASVTGENRRGRST
jgi:hypothetical protein